jgi:hypothetical protein
LNDIVKRKAGPSRIKVQKTFRRIFEKQKVEAYLGV